MLQLHEVQRSAPLPTRYIAPGSLNEALDLLSAHGAAARVIAGGTDLMLELSRGVRSGIELLVDISRLGGHSQTSYSQTSLGEISVSGGRVRLGALVTHADVIACEQMQTAGLPLAQACLEVGSPPLRNRATVVGNIVTASPANDTISALMALRAEVTVARAGGERTVPIAEFITGLRQTILMPEEIVTSVAFDALDGDGRRGVFVKLGLRRAQAISVAHAAVVTQLHDDGRIADLTVALGSVAPTVITVPEAASLAKGRTLADAAADIADAARRAAAPIDDIRASAQYRSHAVGVITERAVTALADGAQAQCWPRNPPRLASLVPAGNGPSDNPPTSNHHVSNGPASNQPTGNQPVGNPQPSNGPAAVALDGPNDVVAATVNGARRSAAAAAGKTLLDWLRDDLGLNGTKEGCAEGECGACAVNLDGAVVFSCLVPAGRAHGASITTVEGVAPSSGELHPLQRALVDTGGVQCGFCTPGFVMSAVALLEETAAPTPGQIAIGLSGNLCRCTGYCSIIEAVQTAAAQAAPHATQTPQTPAGAPAAGQTAQPAGQTAGAPKP